MRRWASGIDPRRRPGDARSKTPGLPGARGWPAVPADEKTKVAFLETSTRTLKKKKKEKLFLPTFFFSHYFFSFFPKFFTFFSDFGGIRKFSRNLGYNFLLEIFFCTSQNIRFRRISFFFILFKLILYYLVNFLFEIFLVLRKTSIFVVLPFSIFFKLILVLFFYFQFFSPLFLFFYLL